MLNNIFKNGFIFLNVQIVGIFKKMYGFFQKNVWIVRFFSKIVLIFFSKIVRIVRIFFENCTDFFFENCTDFFCKCTDFFKKVLQKLHLGEINLSESA